MSDLPYAAVSHRDHWHVRDTRTAGPDHLDLAIDHPHAATIAAVCAFALNSLAQNAEVWRVDGYRGVGRHDDAILDVEGIEATRYSGPTDGIEP